MSMGNTGTESRITLFLHRKIDEFGLPPEEFRLVHYIHRKSSGKEPCWASVEAMARTCRMHPRTIRKTLARLAALKIIITTPRDGLTTHYKVAPFSDWNPSQLNTGVTPPKKIRGRPPKQIQGHPSQTNTDKVYPTKYIPKVNPTKRKNCSFLEEPRGQLTPEQIEEIRRAMQ